LKPSKTSSQRSSSSITRSRSKPRSRNSNNSSAGKRQTQELVKLGSSDEDEGVGERNQGVGKKTDFLEDGYNYLQTGEVAVYSKKMKGFILPFGTKDTKLIGVNFLQY